MSTNSIQGFKALPLRYSSSSTSCHLLFLKEHSIRLTDVTKPPGRTLFILNIPPYATENSLKQAFSAAGGIQKVILEITDDQLANNDGFKRGYVIFAKRENLLKALQLSSLNVLSSEKAPLKTGIAKWVEEYNSSINNVDKMQKEIDLFMSKYDKESTSISTKEMVDDEGWVLVKKDSRRPGLSRKESVATKLNDKGKRKSKKRELKNFYTFQIRESQMKNIVDLRKKYEEAKNKVKTMKMARKFKPY